MRALSHWANCDYLQLFIYPPPSPIPHPSVSPRSIRPPILRLCLPPNLSPIFQPIFLSPYLSSAQLLIPSVVPICFGRRLVKYRPQMARQVSPVAKLQWLGVKSHCVTSLSAEDVIHTLSTRLPSRLPPTLSSSSSVQSLFHPLLFYPFIPLLFVLRLFLSST